MQKVVKKVAFFMKFLIVIFYSFGIICMNLKIVEKNNLLIVYVNKILTKIFCFDIVCLSFMRLFPL